MKALVVDDNKGNTELQPMLTETAQVEARDRTIAQLEIENDRWQRSFEAMPDAIFVTDLDENVKFANFAARNLSGNPIEDIKNVKCWQLFPDFDCTLICPKNNKKNSLSQILPVNFEIGPLANDQFYQISIIPTLDKYKDTCEFLHIFQNITERKNNEQQLIQSQKVEALGTLSAGIAHDFNNILSAIIGYTELAEEGAQSLPKVMDDLHEVSVASRRAKELVSQILLFSCKQNIHINSVHIQSSVSEVLKLIRSTMPTTIELVTSIQAETSLVKADPTQLYQIILNICTNAMYAMENMTGVLTVTLSEEVIEHPVEQSNKTLPAGNYVKLTFRDTGVGIDPNLINLIFDPYVTTKAIGTGTGMGLAVTQGIMDKVGGSISVESTFGEGSVFTLLFPVSNEVDVCIKDENDHSVQHGGNEHVLVVDDEKTIVTIVSRTLKKHGYSVTTATNGMEAWELFRKDPLSFDLIVSDLTMPQLSGVDLAEDVFALRANMPFILMSGYTSSFSIDKAKVVGVVAFAQKPLVVNELLTKVRQVIDRSDK